MQKEEFLKRMKELGSNRNRKIIKVWQFDPNNDQDLTFVKDFAVPYFSAVYQSLINQGRSGYLEVSRLKAYFNLPELIFSRVVKLMNENGDEQIDHDEWLAFFLQLTCSSQKHKMFLVFRIFDVQDSQILRPDFVKIILKHIPLFAEGSRFGLSF